MEILTGFAGGTLAWHSVPAPDRTGPNQDAVGAFDLGSRRGVCVVLDGAGGERDGARASALALKTIGKRLASPGEAARMRAALVDGIEEADRAVREKCPGGAATLAAALWDDGGLRTFAVGDARILWIGGGGRIKYANVPHGPVGYAVEAGLLEPEAAMEHRDRHLISNALGGETTHLELAGPFPLRARDRVLLASDGLTDNLLERRIADLVRRGRADRTLASLMEEASRAMRGDGGDGPGKPDDLSVALWGPAPRDRTVSRRSP